MAIEINEENKKYFSSEILENYEIKLKEFNFAKNNLKEAEENLKIDLLGQILEYVKDQKFLQNLNNSKSIEFYYLDYEIVEFNKKHLKGMNRDENEIYVSFDQLQINEILQLIKKFEEFKNNHLLNKKNEIFLKLRDSNISIEDLNEIEKILNNRKYL